MHHSGTKHWKSENGSQLNETTESLTGDSLSQSTVFFVVVFFGWVCFFKFIFVFTYYYQVQLASSSMRFQVWVWKNALLNTFSGINTENWNYKTGSQLNESGAGDSCLNNPFYLFLCLLTISLAVM